MADCVYDAEFSAPFSQFYFMTWGWLKLWESTVVQ